MLRSLNEWLSYQEHVNVRSVELGLERVRNVWQRMGAPAPARRVITIGGTNGKGSTVAMLEAMLRAADLRVGSYTSPHLLRYNERVRIDGSEVDDTRLIGAFERIEQARGEIPLTYFEFGTLAALECFARAGLDVALLEVGLGGRLDAVNIIDADVAVITTIDLDHMDWLGNDRDQIGHEKAGIARAGRALIVGEAEPPAGLLQSLENIGASVRRRGVDFSWERQALGWQWRCRTDAPLMLPDPPLAAPVQYANAAAAIAALHALLVETGDWTTDALQAAATLGLRQVRIDARLQCLGGDPIVYVDVGHNPQAARALAEWLDSLPPQRVEVVYGALADKDVAGVVGALGARIDRWHVASLDHDTPRGLSAEAVAAVIQRTLPQACVEQYGSVLQALEGARRMASADESILAFGSFFVAAAVVSASSAPTGRLAEPSRRGCHVRDCGRV